MQNPLFTGYTYASLIETLQEKKEEKQEREIKMAFRLFKKIKPADKVSKLREIFATAQRYIPNS